MKKFRTLLLFALFIGVVSLLAYEARPQTLPVANLTLNLSWSNGAHVTGTVKMMQSVYDPTTQTYSYQPTNCNTSFASNGRASCSITLQTDTVYTLYFTLTNPVTNQPVPLNIPFAIPSGYMPTSITAGSYKSTIDVNTNQSVPGSTTISVSF
jgi:hypothetical protein